MFDSRTFQLTGHYKTIHTISRYHLQKSLIAFIEFYTCVVKTKSILEFHYRCYIGQRKNCSIKNKK